MRDKIATYRNGWTVHATKGTLYTVLVRNSSGDIHGKVRTDTYSDAMAYYKSFCAIARNA